MNKLLKINDLSKLKIRKVKSYKLYFDYDNESYLLIDDSDEDSHMSLYKRNFVAENRIQLEFISGAYTSDINQYIKDISKKQPTHLVYSNIDREYFVKKLVENKLVDGNLRYAYNILENKINAIDKKIIELQKQKSELYKEWRTTNKHGSKQYAHDLKVKVAERVKEKAHKKGDFCKQYNDYYGNSHIKYGGILTDLRSLDIGTQIYVCNGRYDAVIGVDKHGDKCMITDYTCVKLTENYNALYIE